MPLNDDNPRRVEIKPADLQKIAQRLRKAAAAVTGLAVSMESKGKKSILVDGNKMLERGFDSIGTFVGNCEKKIKEF